MKKHILTVAVALALGLTANAIHPIHKLFPVKQSDGTTVMLYKNGNGYLAFYTTEDDQVVVRDGNGTLCYADVKDGKLVASTVVVHNMAERTDAEKAFVSSNTLTPLEAYRVDAQEMNATDVLRSPLKSLTPSTSDGLGKYGVSAGGSLPSVGTPTIPVIMVEFSDVKFQDSWTIDHYSRFMNAEGYCEDDSRQVGSVKDYFKSQSRGMFDPTFDVVAKVSLSNGYAYYGQNRNNTRGADSNVIQMVKDAVNGAISQGVSFKKYEVDNKIPNVIILYAGYGEATGGDENTIWPHELDLPITLGRIGDYVFGSYFVGNELNGSSGTSVMGMGVMVHELSHALGFPDLYDTSTSPTYSGDNPYGEWSVMENGPYVNGAYAPIGYTAYERSYMGWLNMRELKDEETVTLTDPNLSEGEMAVMFRNPENTNEYFIIENRQPGTWYPSSFGSGLLLQRISFNSTIWYNNRLNTIQDKKRAMVVTAGGRKIVADSRPADLFGNGVNNKETYSLFAGTQYAGMPIYKILKSPDGTISFNVKNSSLIAGHAVVDENAVYEKVSDVSTLATNDVVVFVNEAENLALAEASQTSGRAAVPVKIDGSNVYGNDFVMPLTLIKAANGSGWAFRTSQNSYLGTSSSGLRTVTKADANCIASMNISDGIVSVSFTGNAAKKNLGFDTSDYNFNTFPDAVSNLSIYRKKSTVDGIDVVSSDSKKGIDSRMFNLAGQQVDAGFKGIVIQNGKKYVKK